MEWQIWLRIGYIIGREIVLSSVWCNIYIFVYSYKEVFYDSTLAPLLSVNYIILKNKSLWLVDWQPQLLLPWLSVYFLEGRLRHGDSSWLKTWINCHHTKQIPFFLDLTFHYLCTIAVSLKEDRLLACKCLQIRRLW